MHELVHFFVGSVLGTRKMSVDFWALEVRYESNDDLKTRIVSLSPLVLGVVLFVAYMLTSEAPNLHVILFLVGLVLLTSYSDLSLRAAKSMPTKWTSIDSSIKIMVGGVMLFAASRVLDIITMRNLPLLQMNRTLVAFFTILSDVAFISGVGVVLIAGVFWVVASTGKTGRVGDFFK